MWIACPDCEHVMEVRDAEAVLCPSCGFHGDIDLPDEEELRLECPRCSHQIPVPAGSEKATCASCGFSADVPAEAAWEAARSAAAAVEKAGAKGKATGPSPASAKPASVPAGQSANKGAKPAGETVWLSCPQCRQWIEVEAGGPIQVCGHCGARIVPPAPAPR